MSHASRLQCQHGQYTWSAKVWLIGGTGALVHALRINPTSPPFVRCSHLHPVLTSRVRMSV